MFENLADIKEKMLIEMQNTDQIVNEMKSLLTTE